MALRSFNSLGGFSVGNDPRTEIILANGDITTINFTANGIVDLGNVSNVIISGGTNGQVLQTDGTGNLSFTDLSSNRAATMPYYIPNGQSYIVSENFQGLFVEPIEIDGEFEVDGILIDMSGGGGANVNASNTQILFASNGNATGNTGFTFDSSSGNLAIPGNATITGNILPSANITYNLGTSTQRWNDIWLANSTIYIGNSSISTDGNSLVLTNGDGGNLVVAGNTTQSIIENGNSNVTINANGTVVTSVSGNANIFTVTGTGANVNGNLNVTGDSTISGNLSVDGNLIYINVTELSVKDPIITLNTGANASPPIANSGKDVGTALYYYDTQARTAFMGWDTSNAEFAFGSRTSISSEVVTFNTLGNVRAQTFLGNVNATNVNANLVTGNYLVSSAGCVTISGATIAVSGNNAGIFASLVDDINLGLAANITMSGATNNVTVQGNLIANNNVTITGNVSANLVTGTLVTGAQPNITSTGTLASLSVTGNVNSGNLTVSNTIDAVNIKVTDLYSKRTSISISTNTQIDTFPTTQFRSAKYTMRAGDGTDYQALEVLLVHNDINSIITVYGSLSTSGSDLVIFTTDISAGNVNVYATAVGPGTNLNLMGTYVPD
jgi:hypothetical protein